MRFQFLAASEIWEVFLGLDDPDRARDGANHIEVESGAGLSSMPARQVFRFEEETPRAADNIGGCMD